MSQLSLDKSTNFALRIIKLYKYLIAEKQEYVLSKQILRSGTSIGANLTEAEYSITKKDFLAKVYISYKECAETQYWLNLLYKSDYLTAEQFDSLNNDCVELLKLLTSIISVNESPTKQISHPLIVLFSLTNLRAVCSNNFSFSI